MMNYFLTADATPVPMHPHLHRYCTGLMTGARYFQPQNGVEQAVRNDDQTALQYHAY
jgi:hypothetical protein